MTQNLPKVGNYFISYMILQALSVSAATLLQLSRLCFFVIGVLLDTTARQKWQRGLEPQISWVTFFPVYTNDIVYPYLSLYPSFVFHPIPPYHITYTSPSPSYPTLKAKQEKPILTSPPLSSHSTKYILSLKIEELELEL